MDKYNGLLKRISDEYSIPRGKMETERSWKARIIYSAIGRIALASLFDDDEEEITSIIHMKNRIKMLLASYKDMYPELEKDLPADQDKFSDEIYDIYLHTGIIYHKPNRIVMATKSEAHARDLVFTRGYELETRQMMSGLGTYFQERQTMADDSLIEMFQLDSNPLDKVWEAAVTNARWSEFQSELNTEYLRKRAPFTLGYWVDKPDKSGTVSLLRTGFTGTQLYYLYKVESGKLLASQLPQWQVEEYQYRLLANASLRKSGVLPPSTFRYDGDIVYFDFGYLPAPEEQYLWKLYSWPKYLYPSSREFNRVCTKKVFDAIRNVMQQKGYQFKEVR